MHHRSIKRCRQRVRSIARIIFFAVLLFQPSAIAVCPASSTPRTITDVSHFSWTAKDGAPPEVDSLAQTKDGYLWIGTSLGLYRFDGVRFTPYPASAANPSLPSRAISAIAAGDQGGLWIGYVYAGISHLYGNTLVNYPLPSSVRGGTSIQALSCCRQDSVWALVGNTILRLHASQWEDFGALNGLPAEAHFAMFFDREGNLWVSARNNVYVLRVGGHRFSKVNVRVYSVTQFAQTKDGTLWTSDAWRGVRPLFSTCKKPEVEMKVTANMVIDPEDNIWLGKDYTGVSRVTSNLVGCSTRTPQQQFRTSEGLTSNVTHALFRDRDGNIWIGTERGIDRLRPRMFTLLEGKTFNFYPALAATPAGALWIGTHEEGLIHVSERGIVPLGRRHPSSPLAVDAAGGLWLGDAHDHKLHHYSSRGLHDREVPGPKEAQNAAVQGIVVKADGFLLGAFEGHGLWSYSKDWKRVSEEGLTNETPSSLVQIGDSTWIGYSNDRLVQLVGHQTRFFAPSDGLRVGAVLSIVEDQDRIWISGTDGVAFLKQDKFLPLHLLRADLTEGVSGIVFDESGNLWLNGGLGVVRVLKSELDLAMQEPKYFASAVLYGEADGIVGSPAQVKPVPSAIKDGRGRLWFATAGNLVYLSPDFMSQPRPLPSVTMQSVFVNGQTVSSYGNQHRLVLPGGRDNRIEFNFAAVDLNTPSQVSYRFKLEGEDKEWQNAGTNRQAVYARLKPGAYRFRVAATNGEDKWSEAVPALLFNVKPAFYQTKGFIILCALVGVGFLWFVYLLRIRYVTARIRDRLEQRSTERLRIARELHDTLLQSIHGLMLRFHYVAESISETDPSREMLCEALERADDLIVEGRNQVQDLRGEGESERSLQEALMRLVEKFRLGAYPEIDITEEGSGKLRPVVQEEIRKVCREALINALNHAKATRIGIDIIHAHGFFEVKISDDGIGIQSEVLREWGGRGHWGLKGMSERAKAIGGVLRIRTKTPSGTEVSVRLRSSAAYLVTHPITSFLKKISERIKATLKDIR
ncbi:integral membrane sensor signal transduction histidine kinase [Terriglobus saanensis SP1PR4]|uniref:Integral membrane sensor signal transduction histidine kinase n=1 Tax=Terriglobus saanensis (strain ATCC BAA-1853 / DSM 23119 / SP1PR4) TaxID=401053 RepID=E8UZ07_TERSS|nr:integral membrane sensor signal transduction histidine kinase [Terriglobus saanensis SP1PR4]